MPTPIDARVLAAARNNAAWCDAVCRAHGGDTRTSARLWWSERPSPPYYPRVVTLDPTATAAELVAAVEGHAADADCAVKDSFATLDLAALGFDELFEAQWFRREPVPRSGTALPLRWSVLETPHELAAWEAAWRRSAGLDPRAPAAEVPAPLYPPALLKAPGVTFVAARDAAGRVLAGCALAAAAGAVGIACAFFDGADRTRGMRDLAAFVQDLDPGRPLTGYAAGAELAAARACGFSPIGRLRVWMRRRPGTATETERHAGTA